MSRSLSAEGNVKSPHIFDRSLTRSDVTVVMGRGKHGPNE